MSLSNIYEAGAVGIAELFADYLEHATESESCIVLALSAHPLDNAAHDAIGKSLAALGYGNNAVAYATLSTANESVEGGDIVLGGRDVFMLVEGLDPLMVIATDDSASRVLGEAYRCGFAPDSSIRAFGRPGVAFADLESMLGSNEGKQRAWRLFKTLPKHT